MSASKAYHIAVPGANLYYELRGSGPLLLMIAAGAGDADTYNCMAASLDDRYTLVTYDRRGYARSPLDNPEQSIEIETHSEDLHHLLSALSAEPASVFGSSIGALIGLDLTVRHAAQVRRLVAHEPPAGELLPPSERANESLPEMFRKDGAELAMQKFMARIGVKHDDPSVNQDLSQRYTSRAITNREAFFKHDAGAVARYRLDMPGTISAASRVVLAGGSAGREYFPYRCALALAQRLGKQVEEFPGGHAGFVDYPHEFAEKLCSLMA